MATKKTVVDAPVEETVEEVVETVVEKTDAKAPAQDLDDRGNVRVDFATGLPVGTVL